MILVSFQITYVANDDEDTVQIVGYGAWGCVTSRDMLWRLEQDYVMMA